MSEKVNSFQELITRKEDQASKKRNADSVNHNIEKALSKNELE